VPFNIKHISAVTVALISISALLGWYFNHPALAAWLPAIANMTFNTALCFLLMALACCVNDIGPLSQDSIRVGAGIAVGAFAILSLSQDIFGLNIGIDNLLFDSHGFGLSSPYPGRMSPVTAIGFLLCSAILIILKQRWLNLTHILITLLGMLGMVGIGMNIFMHDVPGSYSHLASISALTAVSFLLLATALLRMFESRCNINSDLLLHSGIRIMYRLKYPQKFALISIIFIIPLAILMRDELRMHDQRIADAKLKIIGIEHIKETEKLAKAIPEHRGMNNAYLSDSHLFATALHAKAAEIDRLFAENDGMDRLDATYIEIPDEWPGIEERWQHIKRNPDDALLSWRLHTEIITLLNKHLRDVGRQTRLSYDANPGIHNQLSLQLEIMPDLLEKIGQLRGQGVAFLARKSINEQGQISLTNIASNLSLLLSEATQLLHQDKSMHPSEQIQRAFSTFAKSCTAFIDTTQRQLIRNRRLSISAEDYFTLATRTIAEGLALSQANMAHIEYLLEQRINASITAQYNIKLLAMIAALLLLFLFAAFYRSVMNTITALDRVSDRMLRGENEQLELIPASDEMGNIVTSFNAIASQLMQTSAHMSAVVDYAAEGIITIDPDGIIQTFNPAAEHMFGYQAGEIVGANVIRLMPDTFRHRHQAGLKHFVQNGSSDIIDSRKPVVAIGLKKDATKFPMELSISAVQLDNQQMFVGMIRDVSQRHSLENQLRHAQKMEAVGALVGGVAHNFNNLLAGIIGKAYIAKRKIQNNPEVLAYLESIETISDQAAEMIKQLLTFAHKDFFRDQQDITLDILIKESFKTARLGISEDIKLELDVVDTNLVVHCDASQVQQVLMNMMNNARDALEDSAAKQISVRLEACTPADDFFQRHASLAVGRYACLSISDTGCGMDAETADKIFDPFYTTKAVGKGTGLGLSTAFGTITSHRGVIEVDSAIGQGTTFRIFLPLIAAEAPCTSREHQETLRSRRHETLLLVDDEPLLLHATAEVLEELGYEVIKAGDGAQGLKRFRNYQDRIDMVISDVIMPEMSGVEMCRHIRAARTDMPVIFITGYDQNKVQLSDEERQYSCTLSKPVQVAELSQHIESMLKSTHQ